MTRTYLYGYGSYQSRLTEAELLTRWSWRMVHPEFRRRSLAMARASQDAGHDVGFGGGARDAEAQLQEALRRHYSVPCSGDYDRRYNGVCYKLKPGFAPYSFPGSSNHETGVFEGYAIAIDFVGWEDHWFDMNCERYGIKNFGGQLGPNVNGEEWHGQPIEFPNSRQDVNTYISKGGRLHIWPLAGENPTPQPKPDPGDDPIMYIVKPGPEIKHMTDVHFRVHDSGIVGHASGPDTVGITDVRECHGVAHFNIYVRAANHMTGAGLTELT